MEQLSFTVDVPKMANFDRQEVTRELSRYALFLVMNPRKEPIENQADPFACFSGSWGGDGDANEIADQLHESHMFNRNTEAW